jgi:hypothetical protein
MKFKCGPGTMLCRLQNLKKMYVYRISVRVQLKFVGTKIAWECNAQNATHWFS